jgi:hypothetical protein
MAQKTKPAPEARVAKPKSAKQIAKRDANIAAYKARNEAILNGTFKSVADMQAEREANNKIERERETANARKQITAHMSHPLYGARLTKFIGQRPNVDPLKLMMVINNWLKTNGLLDTVRMAKPVAATANVA